MPSRTFLSPAWPHHDNTAFIPEAALPTQSILFSSDQTRWHSVFSHVAFVLLFVQIVNMLCDAFWVFLFSDLFLFPSSWPHDAAIIGTYLIHKQNGDDPSWRDG